MMEVTLINDVNYDAFEDLFFDGTDRTKKDILRIGAVEKGLASGVLSAGFTEGVCNIRSLYTVSALRRRGIARGMLCRLKEILAGSAYSVLTCQFPADAEGMAPFLESEGFLLRESYGSYRTYLNKIVESELVKKHSRLNILGFEFFKLEQLQNADKNRIAVLLKERGYNGYYTDLKSFDERFSSVVYDYDHIPQQCLLVSANEACVFVKLIVSLRNSPDIDTKPLHAQLKGFLETLLEEAGTEKTLREICFEAENPELMPFLIKMAGEDTFEKVCTNLSAVTFI